MSGGPSFFWSTDSLVTGGFLWDTYRGLGIPAADIPTGFALPPFLLNDIDVGDPAGTEYRHETLTLPLPSGWTTFDQLNTSAFLFIGPDGTYAGTKRVWKNGAYADDTYVLGIGAASSVSGVDVSPSTATGSTTFSAAVAGAGTPSQSVSWSATAGSVTTGGDFTAPAPTGSIQVITVTARSDQDPTKSGTATVTIAATSIAPRFARPSADLSAGAWLPSSGSSLYAMIDEPSADSSDYIYTNAAGSCEIALNPVTDPNTSTGQVFRYQVWSALGDGVTIALMQGATVIASWVHPSLPTIPTIFARHLTALECDSITDYANLRLKPTAA